MRLVLTLIYFLVVTPLGWAMRAAGFDPLSTKGKPRWTPRRD
jgi:hypothetical protein